MARSSSSRVLWKSNTVDGDNQVDGAFLSELVVNASVPKKLYLKIVRESLQVTQQITSITLVLAVHQLLSKEELIPFPAIISSAVVISGSIAYIFISDRALLLYLTRQSFLLTSGVYFMAPLFLTLTQPISSDTVISSCAWLLAVHLCFHGYKSGAATSFQRSLSLAAAVFSSVLSASRLHSPEAVFLQVLFSLSVFLFSPMVWGAFGSAWLSVAAYLATSCFLFALSGLYCAAYVAVIVVATFLCTLWLVKSAKFKAQINGPWDQAAPVLYGEL